MIEHQRSRAIRPLKIGGVQQAHPIALTYSPAPAGHT